MSEQQSQSLRDKYVNRLASHEEIGAAQNEIESKRLALFAEVLSINPPVRAYALAQAEAKVTLFSDAGTEVSFVIRDIAVIKDEIPGEFNISFPRYKNPGQPPAHVVLASWHVRKAVTDAVIPAFKQWLAEQEQKQVDNSQQQGGAQ